MNVRLDGRLIAAARDLEAVFADIGLASVIIGGVAASLLATPRATEDIDALIMFDVTDSPRLIASLSRHGFRPLFQDAAEFAIQSRLITVTHEGTSTVVDIMLGCMPFEEELIQRSNEHTSFGFSIRLPTPEDLVILKAIANRPKDLEDIRNIALTYPDMDRKRIEHWVREYGELLETPDLWEQTSAVLDG